MMRSQEENQDQPPPNKSEEIKLEEVKKEEIKKEESIKKQPSNKSEDVDIQFEERDFLEVTPRILMKKTWENVETVIMKRIHVDDVITTHKTMSFMNVRAVRGRTFA